MSEDDSVELDGGFSLRNPDHKYGIFGALAPIAPTFGYDIQEAEWDSSHQKPPRLGDVSVIHTAGRAGIVGGFTLQLRSARQRPMLRE